MNTKQLENFYAKNKQCQKKSYEMFDFRMDLLSLQRQPNTYKELDTYAKTTIP